MTIDIRTWLTRSAGRRITPEQVGTGVKCKVAWRDDRTIAEFVKSAVDDELAKLAGFEPAQDLQTSGFAGGR